MLTANGVVQGAVRMFLARRLMKRIVRANYRRAVDPTTGDTYYYDKRTKRTPHCAWCCYSSLA